MGNNTSTPVKDSTVTNKPDDTITTVINPTSIPVKDPNTISLTPDPVFTPVINPTSIPVKDPNTIKNLSSSYTKFGFKLFSSLDEKGKNIFISPASIAIALSMTYNGADMETKDAMAKTLEINGMTLDELNSANNQLIKSLENLDPKVELSIANSLWCRPGIEFKKDFIDRCKDAYEAEIRNEFILAVINGWISDKTKGKIKKALDSIPDDAILYLINAIYFKGSWTTEFDKKLTEEEDFFLSDGTKKKTPLMSQSGNYDYYRGDRFQSVSLPYGKGNLSMYLFLPDKNSSLEEFQKNLTCENWEKWMKKFNKKDGDIFVPRFKIEYSTLLNGPLSAAGMSIAFNANSADFSKMCSSKGVYISRVIHKTFVDVNEEGTEAAAVTIVEMSRESVSIQDPPDRFYMRIDRPFFFVIRDNTTGIILFMGSISNP